VRGSFVLPKGFVPNRVVVTLKPKGNAAITRRFDWHEALAGPRGNDTP
jgi:hypothetical protein